MRGWIGLLVLVACDGDPDRDGLTNKEERALGTGIKIADSDGDGVLDGDEVEAGTDPLVADTDGDGFDDGEELDAGTDATDPLAYPDTRWPDLSSHVPEGDRAWVIGERVPAFDGVDQRGEELDIDQLYGHVVWLQIVGGEFCAACGSAATNAEGRRAQHADRGLWPVHVMVDDDERDGDVEDAFAATWAERHRLSFPVIVDKQAPNGLYEGGFYTGFIPLTVVLDRDLRLIGAWEGPAGISEAESRLDALLASPFPGE